MDIRLLDATPTEGERQAVDACLGPPRATWDGATTRRPEDLHVAHGGQEMRDRRHQLLPALQALQTRVGWISEGGLAYVCERLDVPPADAWGVATFYALLSTTPRARRVLHVCDDIVCKCRGGDALISELERRVGPAHGHGPSGNHVAIPDGASAWVRSPCLGRCEQGPAALLQVAGEMPSEHEIGELTVQTAVDLLTANRPLPDSRPTEGVPRFLGDQRLLKRVGSVDPTSIRAYEASGGFVALARAIELGPERVIAEVTASGLTGRGGAAFPTGRKWEAVAKQSVATHYLICNADESEPGTFKDRVLMEGDPFAIVEAMAIAGYATACERGFIYIRGEYPLATARLQHAIDACCAHGKLGDDILGLGVRFDIEIRRGGGAYICGEETAIFNSIEGFRGEPRNKPPYPVEAGLFGCPTVVNNVETLANVPLIVLQGGAAFAKVGGGQSTGTKLFCVSGNVRHPGVVEVPFGTTLRQVFDLCGGLPEGRSLQAVLLGGAAGVFVRPDELAIPLTLEGARAAGATLGSGVVVVFDDTADMHDVVRRIAAFFRDESCGQCVPCRVGTVRQEEALCRINAGKTFGGVRTELALLDEVGVSMKDASICGLGQTAYSAVESAIKRLGLYDGRTVGG